MAETYYLTWPPWHTYTDHLKELLHDMKTDDTFADITIVSDDGREIRAHKVVLGASSPTMKNLLTNKDTNTINLKGIAFEEIDSILQFIYLGEATLFEERVQEFLSAAQKLKIKELSKESESQYDLNYEAETQSSITIHFQSKNKCDENGQHKAQNDDTVLKTFECHQCDNTYPQNKQLQAHVKSVHEGLKYACNQCEKQYADQSNLKIHIESKHEGIKYACNLCDYQAKRQECLTPHILSKHKGIKVKYACNQCKQQFTEHRSLKIHMQQSAHEGYQYSCKCNQCDQQFTTQSNLLSHIQYEHEGVKYACNQCDYQAIMKSSLKAHIICNHEDVKYACKNCDYQANSKIGLINHNRTKH